MEIAAKTLIVSHLQAEIRGVVATPTLEVGVTRPCQNIRRVNTVLNAGAYERD
jgi:hypothetical protein